MVATVIFQTAHMDSTPVACLVCPRRHMHDGFRQECRTIVETGTLLLRQYEPSEQTGEGALGEVEGGTHDRTTMMVMPEPGDTRPGNAWDAVLIRTRQGYCVLICPEGLPFTLPAEFDACVRECSWLWIAQYDPSTSSVMAIVHQLKRGHTAPFTIFKLGR